MTSDPYIYKRPNGYVVYKYDPYSKTSKYVGTFPDRESARLAQGDARTRPPKAARRASEGSFDHLNGLFSSD